MAIYPESETDRRVPRVDLLDVVTRVFARCGMNDSDAGLLAETPCIQTCAACIRTASCACPTMSAS